VSARIGMAVAMARNLRKKREAGQEPVAPAPASKPPMTALPPTALESRQMHQAALELEAEQAPAVEPAPALEAERCPKCQYIVGSFGCRNTHGGAL